MGRIHSWGPALPEAPQPHELLPKGLGDVTAGQGEPGIEDPVQNLGVRYCIACQPPAALETR